MRLIKLDGQEGPVYINPLHVVAVRKALRDCKVETLAGVHAIKGEPEAIVRQLGFDEIAKDISPEVPGRRMK